MKLISTLLSMTLLATNFAQATSPQTPYTPTEGFEYVCQIRITKILADSTSRNSSTLSANTVVKKSVFDNAFSSDIDLSNLDWKTLPNSQAEKSLPFKGEGLSMSLKFQKQNENVSAILNIAVKQDSESKLYELSSFGTSRTDFQVGQKMQATANIEEFAKWINNQIPKGILMRATHFNVECLRTN